LGAGGRPGLYRYNLAIVIEVEHRPI
jgi:hypothetical protein